MIVVIFWLAGSPSFVATEKCPLNTNRRAISLVRDAEGISQLRQEKMCAHLLTEKTISRFASLAQPQPDIIPDFVLVSYLQLVELPIP